MGHHGTSLLSLTFPDFIMLYDADFEYPMTHPFCATSRRGIIPGSAKHAPRRHPTVIKKKKRATIGSNGWTSLKDLKKPKPSKPMQCPLMQYWIPLASLAMLKVHIWKNMFFLVSFCLKHWVLCFRAIHLGGKSEAKSIQQLGFSELIPYYPTRYPGTWYLHMEQHQVEPRSTPVVRQSQAKIKTARY